MPQDLRQRRRGSVLCGPKSSSPPASTDIEHLLSTLDELCLTINTLSGQSQLQLQELGDMLQRLQAMLPPPPQTHPQLIPPVSPENSGPTSGPSKIGIFGGQVTFVNTVHNGDDAERAKHSEQLERILRMQYIQTGVFL
ncbi:hypothetical protein BJ165DRAFT_1526404 [Panaeolus papilionaceus]|nr:hypothetical protein BJ165DRAFT_1526404 [Panaeolus papilionaceus]